MPWLISPHHQKKKEEKKSTDLLFSKEEPTQRHWQATAQMNRALQSRLTLANESSCAT